MNHREQEVYPFFDIVFVDKITCNLSIRVSYFTLLSEITNFDSGVLCYLHRGNPIYSGPYLPRQNVLECSFSYKVTIQRPKVSTVFSSVFLLFAIKIMCFPVCKQQVLLHLFSFLQEVAKHLIL